MRVTLTQSQTPAAWGPGAQHGGTAGAPPTHRSGSSVHASLPLAYLCCSPAFLLDTWPVVDSVLPAFMMTPGPEAFWDGLTTCKLCF